MLCVRGMQFKSGVLSAGQRLILYLFWYFDLKFLQCCASVECNLTTNINTSRHWRIYILDEHMCYEDETTVNVISRSSWARARCASIQGSQTLEVSLSTNIPTFSGTPHLFSAPLGMYVQDFLRAPIHMLRATYVPWSELDRNSI